MHFHINQRIVFQHVVAEFYLDFVGVVMLDYAESAHQLYVRVVVSIRPVKFFTSWYVIHRTDIIASASILIHFIFYCYLRVGRRPELVTKWNHVQLVIDALVQLNMLCIYQDVCFQELYQRVFGLEAFEVCRKHLEVIL